MHRKPFQHLPGIHLELKDGIGTGIGFTFGGWGQALPPRVWGFGAPRRGWPAPAALRARRGDGRRRAAVQARRAEREGAAEAG